MNLNDVAHGTLHGLQGMFAKGATHTTIREAVVDVGADAASQVARTGSEAEVAFAGANRAIDGVGEMRDMRASVIGEGSIGGVSKRVREVHKRFGDAPVSITAMRGKRPIEDSVVYVSQGSEISLHSIVNMQFGRKGVTGVRVADWTPPPVKAPDPKAKPPAPPAAADDAEEVYQAYGAYISREPMDIANSYPVADQTKQARDGVKRVLITVMDKPGQVTMSPEYIRRVLTRRGVKTDILHLRNASIDSKGHVRNGKGKIVAGYDAVITRGGSDHRTEHLAILHQLRRNGMKVRNGPEAIAIAGNKARTAEAISSSGVPHPPTMEIRADENVAAKIAAHLHHFEGKPVVLKPVSDMGGAGVVFLEAAPQTVMESVAKQLLARPSTEGIIVQEWLKDGVGRDVRAFIVRNANGEVDVLPYALKRVAPEGMGAANASTGATLHKHKLTDEQVAMAKEAADAAGMDFGGVDFIAGPNGQVVVEINTSAGTTHIISNLLGKKSSLAHYIADQALGRSKHSEPWGPNFLRIFGF